MMMMILYSNVVVMVVVGYYCHDDDDDSWFGVLWKQNYVNNICLIVIHLYNIIYIMSYMDQLDLINMTLERERVSNNTNDASH